MEQLCPICEEVLGDRPRSELLCHHVYHSECLFRRIQNATDFFDVECVTCQELLLPLNEGLEEEEDNQNAENESVQERDRIQNLWLTNERFRKHIRAYHKANREISKPKMAFAKLLAIKKAELLPRFTLLKAQYEGLAGVKKDEIKESQEYKTYRSTLTKSIGMFSRLRRDYEISQYHFRHLRGYPGLRLLGRGRNRWRSTPGYMIRRALRLRLY